MVRCVVVSVKKLESVRRDLSKQDIIDKSWKIETQDGLGFIPIKEDLQVEYETVDKELESRKKQQSISDILGYSPTYEWLGNIVLLDESENLNEIIEAFKKSSHCPKTILNKQSDVEGVKRTREWDVLYGNETETLYSEYGFEYMLDITDTYFTPRLSNERQRVANKISQEENVFDMFAGVGPYAIPIASNGSDVVAVDINKKSIEYLSKNIRMNSVSDNVTPIHADVRSVATDYTDWADAIVMNLPHTANEFINEAVEIARDGAYVFYYDFCHENKGINDIENEIMDEIHNRDVTIDPIDYRSVRPYAPNVENICFEFCINNGEG